MNHGIDIDYTPDPWCHGFAAMVESIGSVYRVRLIRATGSRAVYRLEETRSGRIHWIEVRARTSDPSGWYGIPGSKFRSACVYRHLAVFRDHG